VRIGVKTCALLLSVSMVGLTACSETAGRRPERQSGAAAGAQADISYDADDEAKFATAPVGGRD